MLTHSFPTRRSSDLEGMPGWQHATCSVRSTSPTSTPFDLSTPSHSCRVSVIEISPLQLLCVQVQGSHRSALSLCHCALDVRGLCTSTRCALPTRLQIGSGLCWGGVGRHVDVW